MAATLEEMAAISHIRLSHILSSPGYALFSRAAIVGLLFFWRGVNI